MTKWAFFREKLSFRPVCSMESSTVVASACGLYVPHPSGALLAVSSHSHPGVSEFWTWERGFKRLVEPEACY